MFDIIFFVLSLMISLIISSFSIKRGKGEDWYAPITNNAKMVMSTINIAIILTIIFQFLLLNIKLFVSASMVIIIITMGVIIYNYIFNNSLYFMRIHNIWKILFLCIN